MHIDSRASDSIRSAILRDTLLPQEIYGAKGFSLPGLLETVAAAAVYGSRAAMSGLVKAWGGNARLPFAQVWQRWTQGNAALPTYDIHGTRGYEFHALKTREDLTGTDFQLFQERFVRSLKQLGVPTDLAYAYAGAFAEMIDNVIQHSSMKADRFNGLAGYHVCPNYFAFGVVDVGRGILSSLTSASAWQHLQTADEALYAAVCDNASRRPGHQYGEGFKELFRSMADRQCRLRFRSDDALLVLKDAGHQFEATQLSSPPLAGFQMSVVCSLNGEAHEKEIEENFLHQ